MRRAPRSTGLRMAVANIHRPGALTPTIVLSLGLGITLLVTVIEIDGNLRRQFSNELPAKAPSFYFLDIPADQAERFEDFVRAQAPAAKLEDVPMLRGRIISAGGTPAEKIKPRGRRRLGAAKRPRHHLCQRSAGRLAAGRRAMVGPDYNGPPLVSFEKRIADGLGLKLGDPVTVNVLGRNITASIANMRAVDWQSLGHQFRHGVFAERLRRRAAHASRHLTYPGGGTPAQEAAMIARGGRAFPDGHHGAREGCAGGDRRASSPIWCWRSAAPAPSR